MSIDPEVYRALAVAAALRLYARTGMLANKSYRPAALLRTAAVITGKKFKRGAYLEAAEALRTWAHSQ